MASKHQGTCRLLSLIRKIKLLYTERGSHLFSADWKIFFLTQRENLIMFQRSHGGQNLEVTH